MNEKTSCITINCGCCGNGGTSGGSGAENVYSTEETVCGIWIDGKPIYRKVIEKDGFTSPNVNSDFGNIEDIDTIVDLRGVFSSYHTGAKNTIVRPISFCSTTYKNYGYVNINKDTGAINVKIDMGEGSVINPPEYYKVFVIVEYTKQ